VTGYLEPILAWHRASRPWRDPDRAMVAGAASAAPPRDFRAALMGEGLGVIAEIKRRSPSAGDIAADLDPAMLALEYEEGGASALSVLTDSEFFGGSAADLGAARGAIGLPVLRKDFTVSPTDVFAARAMGADAVLLIVAALEQAQLAELHLIVSELGMVALVEAHDRQELDRAAQLGAGVIGINQRDLRNFKVNRELATELGGAFPPGVLKVAESGIRDADDAARLAGAGYDAILVGESLLRHADRRGALAALGSVRTGVIGCS
jgi:indole-3-glycerol phosphate synthase